MTAFKTIGKAAVCGLTLMAATLAYAQGSTGSTDIYTTNFQEVFPSERSAPQESSAGAVTASTDIYTTDFQKAFATDKSTNRVRDTAAYKGSTDIYSTDFPKSFM
jgi:hypothetical protein